MSFTQAPQAAVTQALNGRAYLDNLANKAILRPKGAVGIGGFVFDYDGESAVELQAEITDHFAEDNSVLNDHMAIKPARLVLRGFVGEVIEKAPQGVQGVLSSLQSKLTIIPAYLGKYTPQMLGKVQGAITKAQQVVNTVDEALAKAKNIVGMFPGGSPAKSNQATQYAFLESLMNSRQIFLVETPYRFFTNMVIERLSYVQPEETKSWSEVSITLKEMRFAQVESIRVDPDTFAGRAALQRQDTTDVGQTQGTEETPTVADSLFFGGRAVP